MSKNREKNLKPILNDFHDQRTKRMCIQTVCSQKTCQTLLIVKNLLTNDQNGQTAQNLKCN